MSTATDVRDIPLITAHETPPQFAASALLPEPTRVLVAASLAVGVVFGFGGNFLPPTPQTIAQALSSIGLVVGSMRLVFAFLRQGREVVATGLSVLAIAEIVMWNNGREGELAIIGFAAAVMFYVPALLMISLPPAFPIWSRVAGALAAVPFGVHAGQFLLGGVPSPAGPYAIAGYMLMSIAIVGWIVSALRSTARGATAA